MTFTSNIFLIGLLPWFVGLFHLVGGKKLTVRTILLFLANSVFYLWGGTGAFLFLCCYTVLIWLLCLALEKIPGRPVLAAAVLLAIAPLVFVKYAGFVIQSLNGWFGWQVTAVNPVLPIGISFFTFEAVSLLADVYKKRVTRHPAWVDVYLYLTFFPTITSGPIIRFNEFETGLRLNRGAVPYTRAIERIIIGLGKKVLVADKIAVLADYYFDGLATGGTYSTLGLWLGSVAYTLQLYFDFSGYSDMAIGIGQLLGFEIRENFNHPYQAGSISDFWKRWHISLTQWFRDYVYIPLGGNRCAVPQHLLNMLAVWLLTGIWHGADWAFVLWGLGYFVLLVFEKYVFPAKKISGTVFGHVYALFFINLLWVPFRAGNLGLAAKYLGGMFTGTAMPLEDKAIRYAPLLIVAGLLCLPWNRLTERVEQKMWFRPIKGMLIIALGFLAVCAAVNSSYAPYIYGNF